MPGYSLSNCWCSISHVLAVFPTILMGKQPYIWRLLDFSKDTIPAPEEFDIHRMNQKENGRMAILG